MTLRVNNLCVGYGDGPPVLDGLSAEFADGITVILGPNGCGKTTLLRAIGGVIAARGGEVNFHGLDLLSMRALERARRLALIPQRPSISAAFTVEQVVALGRFAVGRDDQAIERAIERTDLAPLRAKLFNELSAGQQQRVTLARALAQLDSEAESPRLLLADEPFSAMDPARAMQCVAILRELAESGVTILLVAHDFTTSARVADQALLLDPDGRIVEHGQSAAVLQPKTLERAFGVGFERIDAESGPIVVPRGN